MAHVIELLASWVLTTALTFAVILADERWLIREDQLEWAWPPSSRDAAIIGFGPLAIPLHFIRTRGLFRARYIRDRFAGIALAVAALFVVGLLSSLGLTAIFWALGIPEPPE